VIFLFYRGDKKCVLVEMADAGFVKLANVEVLRSKERQGALNLVKGKIVKKI